MCMGVKLVNPCQINWVGQTFLWPTKDEHWPRKRQAIFALHRQWSQAVALKTYRTYYVSGLGRQDYIQYASIGLLESIDRYEPNRGVGFRSYAVKRIRGAILTNIAKFSEESSFGVWRKRQISDRLQSLTKQQGSTTEPERLVIETILDLATSFLIEEELDLTLAQQEEHSDLNGFESDALVHNITATFEGLPQNMREVMELHYTEHKSFSDIAKQIGLSLGRVSQIHSSAIETIRKKLCW